VLAVLLIAAVMLRSREWRRIAPVDDGAVFRRQIGKSWFGFSGFITVCLCIASLGIPLFQLASLKRTWTEMPSAIEAAKTAIGNSLMLSALAATAVIAIGVLSTIKQIGEHRRLGWIVGQALWLPFLIPGVLIGIAIIALFNRPVLSAFYQSSGVVLLAFAIRYLAIGWNGAAQAFRTVDRELTDAARLEGASTAQLFRFVHLPQIGSQLAAVWYVVFLLCLWDVESIILIIPPGGQTLATTIFNLLHYGYNAQVNALCVALLLVALVPLVAWNIWVNATCALQRVRTA
jgi:iron(III) transport system permease protein